MPKIIEDIRNRILTEAKQQLLSEGYSGMTLRSVAAGCSIAVGTIYNYFKSKDVLIASFMLEDWKETLAEMKRGYAASVQPVDVFGCVYRGIVAYSERYARLFGDAEARRSAGGFWIERHAVLRSQLASLITDTCRTHAIRYTDELPEFVAEAILSYAQERKAYTALSDILSQLFRAAPQNPSLLQPCTK